MLLSERIKARLEQINFGMVPCIRPDELVELQILEKRVERFDAFLMTVDKNQMQIKNCARAGFLTLIENKHLFLMADKKVVVDFAMAHLESFEREIDRCFEVPS